MRKLAKVSEEEQQQRTTLSEEIEALRSQTSEAQAKVAQAEQQFLQACARTLQPFAAFDSAKYERARAELIRAREEYDRATKSAFAGIEIPGILQREWRAFVQSGEALLASTQRPNYPSQDDDCVYCGQRLDAAAIELIQKYRDYCNNRFQTAVTTAEAVIADVTGPLLQAGIVAAQEAVRTKIAERTDNGYATFLQELADVLAQAATLQGSLKTQEAVGASSLPADTRRIAGELDTRRQEFAKLETDLKRRAGERGAALKEREVRLLELSARLRLADRFPDVQRFVEEAQWVNKANILTKSFQNIFKTLTEASKSASEKLLNQDFEKRFREECKKLRTPEVKLFFPGRQGQVSRRKSVSPDHRLSEILSEGEQKVIALADFLAEVALKPKAPVIFDDPVNSLDYRRMSELVDRLVELSRDRQVVIFTHNIWFTMELLHRFEKNAAECSYYDVQGDGARLGVVTKGSHPRADNFKTLKGKLNTLIESAERATGETQSALVEKGYEYLREALRSGCGVGSHPRRDAALSTERDDDKTH